MQFYTCRIKLSSTSVEQKGGLPVYKAVFIAYLTQGLLLGLVVLAGIALAVLTASNRKAEQAASEAADGSIPVLAIPSDTVRKIQMEARSGTLTLAYADGSWSLAEDPDYHT